MIFSYDREIIYQTIIMVLFILLDRILIQIASSTMGIYSPTANGDVITKWERNTVVEIFKHFFNKNCTIIFYLIKLHHKVLLE